MTVLEVDDSNTKWKTLSKKFAKIKPRQKDRESSLRRLSSFFRSKKLSQSVLTPVTAIGESPTGYQAAFTEKILGSRHGKMMAMTVKLPNGVTTNDVTVTVELNVMENDKLVLSESKIQEPMSMYCTEENESQTIFRGILKIPSEFGIENLVNMPLYLIDSKENVVLNSGPEVSHKTIFKTSKIASVTTAANNQKSPDDIQVTLTFDRRQENLSKVLIESDVTSTASYSSEYDFKYEIEENEAGKVDDKENSRRVVVAPQRVSDDSPHVINLADIPEIVDITAMPKIRNKFRETVLIIPYKIQNQMDQKITIVVSGQHQDTDDLSKEITKQRNVSTQKSQLQFSDNPGVSVQTILVKYNGDIKNDELKSSGTIMSPTALASIDVQETSANSTFKENEEAPTEKLLKNVDVTSKVSQETLRIGGESKEAVEDVFRKKVNQGHKEFRRLDIHLSKNPFFFPERKLIKELNFNKSYFEDNDEHYEKHREDVKKYFAHNQNLKNLYGTKRRGRTKLFLGGDQCNEDAAGSPTEDSKNYERRVSIDKSQSESLTLNFNPTQDESVSVLNLDESVSLEVRNISDGKISFAPDTDSSISSTQLERNKNGTFGSSRCYKDSKDESVCNKKLKDANVTAEKLESDLQVRTSSSQSDTLVIDCVDSLNAKNESASGESITSPSTANVYSKKHTKDDDWELDDIFEATEITTEDQNITSSGDLTQSPGTVKDSILKHYDNLFKPNQQNCSSNISFNFAEPVTQIVNSAQHNLNIRNPLAYCNKVIYLQNQPLADRSDTSYKNESRLVVYDKSQQMETATTLKFDRDKRVTIPTSKISDLKACLIKMNEILVTATSLSLLKSNKPCFSSNSNSIMSKSDLEKQLSQERQNTYRTVENDIKQVIRELIKESEDIKDDAIMKGAKEEFEPPFIVDYIKPEPINYTELCSVVMNEMEKHKTDIVTIHDSSKENLVDIIDSLIESAVKQKDTDDLILKPTGETENSELQSSGDVVHLETEKNIINTSLGHFCTTATQNSKIPKTSFSFGEAPRTRTTTPTAHSKSSTRIRNATPISKYSGKIEKSSSINERSYFSDNPNNLNHLEEKKKETDINVLPSVELASNHFEKHDKTIKTLSKSKKNFEMLARTIVDNPNTEIAHLTTSDEEIIIKSIDLDGTSTEPHNKRGSVNRKNHSDKQFLMQNMSDHDAQLYHSYITLAPKHAVFDVTKGSSLYASSPDSIPNLNILRNVSSGGSDADDEEDEIKKKLKIDIRLPTPSHISKQELNSQQEIDDIEKNLSGNERLNSQSEENERIQFALRNSLV
ncbi:hypothetical protein FQA39_LY01305 [Lamprigera yunnana]|nr:hypothetical protein FQA39_LY01305 [Lamprigera yunnana]